MKLTFKDSRNNVFTLTVQPTQTILSIKIALLQLTGTFFNTIVFHKLTRILFYGTKLEEISLEDHRLVKDYEINELTPLQLVDAPQKKITDDLLLGSPSIKRQGTICPPDINIIDTRKAWEELQPQVLETLRSPIISTKKESGSKQPGCRAQIRTVSSPDLHPLKFFETTQKRTLNYWQRASLDALQEHGLTAEMLLNRQDNGHNFDYEHKYALTDLIQSRKFTVETALAEIEGLSSTQTCCVSLGYSREMVLKLNNDWHISALATFGNAGLCPQMLLNLKENGHVFGFQHYHALTDLIKNRDFNVEAALAEIEGLSSEQANCIRHGYSREQIIPLHNYWHVAALKELSSEGLTAQMLLNLKDNGHLFDNEHYRALIRLINYRNFTIEAALAEIEGLSSDQAIGIADGLLRQDVIHLHNVGHIRALSKLKHDGLTVNMLLNCKLKNEFDIAHSYTLVKLVQEQGHSVTSALDEITHLSCDQARQFINKSIHQTISTTESSTFRP